MWGYEFGLLLSKSHTRMTSQTLKTHEVCTHLHVGTYLLAGSANEMTFFRRRIQKDEPKNCECVKKNKSTNAKKSLWCLQQIQMFALSFSSKCATEQSGACKKELCNKTMEEA